MKKFLKIFIAILLFPLFFLFSFVVGLIDIYSIYNETFDDGD